LTKSHQTNLLAYV